MPTHAQPARDYLAQHKVTEKLAEAVAKVIEERPANPLSYLGNLLSGASANAEDPEFEEELKRGDWASNRAAYDAVRMYYRWTFMPVSKDRRRPLQLLASRGVTDCTDRDIYTFGGARAMNHNDATIL